jgi:hypothetical protein
MLKTLRFGAVALALCISLLDIHSACAATRAYLMRGLGGAFLSTGEDQIGARLRRLGVIVMVGDWTDREAFVQDAMRHRSDRIIFSGHSMGDLEAFVAGAELRARGLKVRVVGLDPLCTGPRMTRGLDATNIWGNYCGLTQGSVAGARNVYLPGPSHIGYPSDPRIQARAIAAMLH